MFYILCTTNPKSEKVGTFSKMQYNQKSVICSFNLLLAKYK